MTTENFSYDDYKQTRSSLIDTIQERLTDNDKKFLLSFEKGETDWSLFSTNIAKDLPAVKWKLQNIQKLKDSNPKKHEEMIFNLKRVLSIED